MKQLTQLNPDTMSKPSTAPQARGIKKRFFMRKLPVTLSNNLVFPKLNYDLPFKGT
jgi:hypothetical protein